MGSIRVFFVKELVHFFFHFIADATAGAGKSILMYASSISTLSVINECVRSTVIDYLNGRFRGENVKIVSVYFDYNSQDTQNAVNLAKSLLNQLLSDPDIPVPEKIETLYNERKQLDKTILFEVLASCSQQFSTVYTIFDAVDESKEAYHLELLDLFVHLQNLRYKIVISGRPGSPLNKIQSKLDSKVIEIRANSNDLESYVCARVQEGLLRKLCIKLIPKADGMYAGHVTARADFRFLLLKLQLDHVLECSRDPRKQIAAFKTLPKTLEAAYDTVIERIGKSEKPDDKELALKIFSWLYFAKRRNLTMNELLDALAFDTDEDIAEAIHTDVPDEFDIDVSEALGSIDVQMSAMDVIECCKSLVTHDQFGSGMVRFTHETVRVYMGKNLKNLLLSEGHLAQTCLTYLNESPEFDTFLSDNVSKPNFRDYAANFWVHHLDNAIPTPRLLISLHRLFTSKSLYAWVKAIISNITYPDMFGPHSEMLREIKEWLVETHCEVKSSVKGAQCRESFQKAQEWSEAIRSENERLDKYTGKAATNIWLCERVKGFYQVFATFLLALKCYQNQRDTADEISHLSATRFQDMVEWAGVRKVLGSQMLG
jgi:hypothetical protein